ncbi:pyruvate dehydrogenase complex subunit PDH-E1Alpha [Cardiosporidium cionae]|uniref:Pyruvate dehydrogenase E1 component subunit alpha n=1 Tax=Cardiosporidium cionae TaxID=476202 RepID=A0ABQ7JBG1_9APIC|nr:pyruvate dehydrogenase complex subunit PDH-E1Alpha [Cardiosporidium cionae]|eukprot:KAF8821345.1 pyruvate dehydrogenase complex subunit PDH-E1Alpha [Cardiosporidium cionae]
MARSRPSFQTSAVTLSKEGACSLIPLCRSLFVVLLVFIFKSTSTVAFQLPSSFADGRAPFSKFPVTPREISRSPSVSRGEAAFDVPARAYQFSPRCSTSTISVPPPVPIVNTPEYNSFSSAPSSKSSSLLTRSGHVCSPRDDVSQEVAQMLYEDLLLGRYAEDMCAQMYYRGRVAGFVHLYSGQEAISTGVIKALKKDDMVISTYRDHVHALSKGVPAEEVLAELYGKATGCSKGRGGSMHMFSKEHGVVGGFAFIGEQIPVALGMAFSAAYRKNTPQSNDASATQVAVCFLGDGATNNGQFYEALNMASLAKLPIIFVVENNNWAIGMAACRSASVPEAYKKADGFGLPGVEVDGMDVLAVRSAARKAIDRARSGGGPTLIEALTYRFRGHSLADPDELRAPLERKTWLERDPVTAFERYMKSMGYTNDPLLKYTQKKVRNLVKKAMQFAESSPEPDLQELGKYVFSPPYKSSPEEFSTEDLNAYANALGEELRLKERKAAGEKLPASTLPLSNSLLKVID